MPCRICCGARPSRRRLASVRDSTARPQCGGRSRWRLRRGLRLTVVVRWGSRGIPLPVRLDWLTPSQQGPGRPGETAMPTAAVVCSVFSLPTGPATPYPLNAGCAWALRLWAARGRWSTERVWCLCPPSLHAFRTIPTFGRQNVTDGAGRPRYSLPGVRITTCLACRGARALHMQDERKEIDHELS